MKNILKYLLIFSLGVFVFTSCDDLNEPLLWEGLEVGFENSTSSVEIDLADSLDFTVQVPIMLIGAHQDQAVTVNVGIDYAATSAITETQYLVPNQTVTIPANSSFGYLDITIVRDGYVQANEAYELVLMIMSSDVKVATHFNDHVVSIYTAMSYNVLDFLGAYTWLEYDVTNAGWYTETIDIQHVEDDTVEFFIWGDETTMIEMYFIEEDNTCVLPGGQVMQTAGTVWGSFDSMDEDVYGTFVNGGESWELPDGYGAWHADGSVYWLCNTVTCTRPDAKALNTNAATRR